MMRWRRLIGWIVRLILIALGGVIARRTLGKATVSDLIRPGHRRRPDLVLPAVAQLVPALDLQPGMRVALVGAVDRYADPLARAVGPTGRVYGVGGGPALLDRVEADLWRARLTNVDLWSGPVSRLPLPDRSVDRVLWVVEPAEQPIDAVIAELVRVLRPDGRAVLVGARAVDALVSAVERTGFHAEALAESLLALRRP